MMWRSTSLTYQNQEVTYLHTTTIIAHTHVQHKKKEGELTGTQMFLAVVVSPRYSSKDTTDTEIKRFTINKSVISCSYGLISMTLQLVTNLPSSLNLRYMYVRKVRYTTIDRVGISVPCLTYLRSNLPTYFFVVWWWEGCTLPITW